MPTSPTVPVSDTPNLPSLPEQVSPPVFTLSERGPADIAKAQVIALPVLPAEDARETVILGPGATEVIERFALPDLVELLIAEEASGKAGEVTTFPVVGEATLRRVLLIGVGDQSSASFRKAGAALARATRGAGTVVTTIPAIAPDDGIEPFVVAATLASFTFNWRSAEPPFVPPASIVLAEVPTTHTSSLDRAVAIAGASWRARFLATVPSNLKNPAWLAQQAAITARENDLRVTIWDEKRLLAEGFGGIAAVGQASATPPRFVRLDYTPARRSRRTPTVVLVGKGITFDSGGLSIKPSDGMLTMKRDMTGAGVVLATMAALKAVDCRVRVVGLLCVAENAISGSALRPGDVIRHYGGRTSEVTNTDAEGRLVLADGLAYAVSEIEPDVVVDIATLTGAIKVALGQTLAGLFANDDGLAGVLSLAGQTAGEPLWRLPLSSSYEDKLSSKIADADNAPGGPGSITAALFLQHFVGETPWAHLDIASVGDAHADVDEWTPGPTGFGARLLLNWLGQPEPLAALTA